MARVKLTRIVWIHGEQTDIAADWLARSDEQTISLLRHCAKVAFSLERPRINYKDLKTEHNGQSLHVETQYA